MIATLDLESDERQPAPSPSPLVPLEEAGESGLAGYAYVPERVDASAPLLVAVHGIARDAREQALAFRPIAEARGWVLLAPRFREDRHGDYQRLGRVGRGPRADHALDDLIAACAKRFGLTFDRRFLVGYSAGGQFVHRYAMAHPERVDAAVVGAPGWFTFPDATLRFPQGLRVGAELPGVRMVPTDFLRIPLLLTVGSHDVERNVTLRRGPKIDRLQGQDRVERALRWADSMNRLACKHGLPEPVRLHVLKGVGHDFAASCAAGLLTVSEAFLCEPWRRRGDELP